MAKDSTVADLEQLHRQAKSARSRLEPVWLMNLAYYTGDQWLAWDGRQLYSPALRRSRITIVDNRIQPVVRTEVAKMTKNRPVWVVTPRTADDSDANAAQMGEQIMDFMWKHLGMGAKITKALLWSRICGAGFLKTFWDPTLGDGVQVLVGPDNNPILDASGRPMRADGMDPDALSQQLGAQVQAKQVNQGDVTLEVRSPFQMFCDPIPDVFTDCEWVIEESIKSTEHVLRQYGVELPADTPANPGIVESRMAGFSQAGSGGYKGVRIREYWAGQSSANPNGKRMVWAGQKILLEDDHPFDTLPYVMFKGIEVPGRLWPGSIVEQLRGPQTELNKVKSQIAENRNRVGNPTIAAAKQSVQDADKFVDSMTMPGGVYFYDDTGTPNAVPVFLQAPQLPGYVLQEIDRIETSIQEIAGQHEVTSANVPPGVTAASAISLLMDADDTRLGPAVTDFETELGELGQKVLTLVADGYTDTRAIRLAGENDAWEIFDFKGAMLSGNTHVSVQAGSAFPQNKAEKQAAMQDLLTFFVQSGNAPHGRQLAQFLRDWGVGGADRMLEDFSRDETQVNRENQRLGLGAETPINEWDNDQAHLDGHEDFQKTMRYEALPQPSQVVFAAHVAAHRARLANQQATYMQMQQPGAGGAPAPPAGAPAPGPAPLATQGA